MDPMPLVVAWFASLVAWLFFERRGILRSAELFTPAGPAMTALQWVAAWSLAMSLAAYYVVPEFKPYGWLAMAPPLVFAWANAVYRLAWPAAAKVGAEAVLEHDERKRLRARWFLALIALVTLFKIWREW